MTDQPNPLKVKAFHLGLEAEVLVKTHLEEQGYDCLTERYKTKYGEIDLIMEQGPLTIFVEVKARRSVEEGLHSITKKSQKRIADSASLWIASNAMAQHQEQEFRFDVAIVTPDQAVTLIEGAFTLDT